MVYPCEIAEFPPNCPLASMLELCEIRPNSVHVPRISSHYTRVMGLVDELVVHHRGLVAMTQVAATAIPAVMVTTVAVPPVAAFNLNDRIVA